ncbi:hypothetical protein LEMLEM_LOCUS19992 [Lemmus lemmus]
MLLHPQGCASPPGGPHRMQGLPVSVLCPALWAQRPPHSSHQENTLAGAEAGE